jgi:hypothetical protein
VHEAIGIASVHGEPTKRSVQPQEQPMAKPTKAIKTRKPKAKSATGTSKIAKLETLLRRSEGATIAQLVKALDWQAHSVRGAISGALKKQLGLAIISGKAEGEERIYRIVG